jgi:L,D-peptidoglycan transpeptidase YkuD (ErfK/YbiS/YcfS/YnhG family)
VFFHVARPDRGPTAGCVAMAPNELRTVLARLSRNTRINIHF